MPIVSIPLYWPLSWPRREDAPAGRYDDWLLWRYARRQEMAAMFEPVDPPANRQNLGGCE